MAEQFSLDDQYDGNEYFRYKSHEKEALRALVGSDNYEQWSVREIYRAAEQAVPLLSKSDLNTVINHLQKSTTSRRKFSLRFRFAPKKSQIQHAHWQDMIERISKLAQQNIANVIAHDQYRQEKLTLLNEHKDSEQCPGGHLTAEQEQVEELEDSILSVDEATFLRFLEEIELCVAQAEALWKRVALTELDLSTAAILTSTYIRTIRSMITAETLLSPSWFEGDCVTKSLSGLNSTYWTELEACAKSIGEIYMHMVSPVFESGMPRCHAPTLTQLLTELKDPRTCKTIFDTPLIIAVAASLVCRFQKLTIPTNSPFLQQLGLSVEEQIRAIEPILQRQLDVYKDNSTFRDISERTEKIRKWAGLCRDPISFGHMMSWLRINRVLCIQLFIHDSSILQLFAYICERIRLRDEKVHLALEELLDDERIAGFLYLDGRPKDLKECERGIRRWSDPTEMLKNLERTQRIFRSRCKSTVAQQILDEKGRVTSKIVKQLNGKTLEYHLRWELGLPNPIQLEAILIDAINGTTKRKSITSMEKAWFHLRTRILYRPEKERELLSKFMERFRKNFQRDA